jgi:hypothetical protein
MLVIELARTPNLSFNPDGSPAALPRYPLDAGALGK